MLRITLCAFLSAVLGAFAVPVHAVPAVPGAVGFGASSAGGRGGDVYHVTTLANDPAHAIPGSLFYGLYYLSLIHI